MKRSAILINVISLIIFFVLTVGTSKAQDKCSDILKEKIFKTERFRDNFYFQQIIYSRFLSSSYEDSKDDSDLGFGIPVGKIVIGGNYSREEFNQKKEQIRKEHFEKVTTTREIDVALSSGDPVVVKAWSDCMSRNGGGISLRFDPVSNTEVFAIIEYFAPPGVPSTRLDENIRLPAGARITQGPHCFRKGTPLRDKVGCRATIIFRDAFTSWAVSVNTPHGGTQAYLTPRIKPQPESHNYEFDIGRVVAHPNGSFTADRDKDNLFTDAYRTTNTADKTIRITEQQKAQGWSFDPDTANVRLNIRRRFHRNGCKITRQEADSYSFSYSLRVWGRTSGRSANSTAVCDVTPSIKMVRVVWVPIYPTVRS